MSLTSTLIRLINEVVIYQLGLYHSVITKQSAEFAEMSIKLTEQSRKISENLLLLEKLRETCNHETSFADIYDEKITLMMPKIHESSVDLGSRRGATRLLTRRGAFGNQRGTLGSVT